MLTGEENIRVMGVSVAVQRETERSRQLEFLQATANPIDAQIIGPDGRAEILRSVASTIGLDGTKIVPSEDDLKAKEQAQAQAAAQQQQMAQAGAGQSARLERHWRHGSADRDRWRRSLTANQRSFTVAKSKVKSEKSGSFAKGGKTKMFGKQHAGPQKPGVSAKDPKGDGGKWAKGGSTHMFGRQSASPAKAGMSGK
jgi:hypothetical protein